MNSTERRQLAAGETLFVTGEAGNQMFGVIEGVIELRGDDRVLSTVAAGETFGEMAIVDGGRRSLTAVAATPAEVAVIDRATFLYLVHETPTFAIQVMASLASRLRAVDGLL